MIYGFYEYEASALAAVIAAIFFCMVLAFSGFHVCLSKSWFMCTNIIAIIMEIIGLATRVLSITRPQDLGAYIVSVIFLTLAPSVQAANLYMLAGRVIRKSTPASKQNFKTLWFNPSHITLVFVGQDVVAFAVQLFGVGFLIKTVVEARYFGGDPTWELQKAMKILVLGFSIQIASLCVFMVLLVRFYFMSKEWFPCLRDRGCSNGLVRIIFYVLWSSTVLLIIRTVYRLNEFVAETGSTQSVIVSQEWPFWVFEIAVVFLMFITYLVPQYPGWWFARGGALELGFDEEAKQYEKPDPRALGRALEKFEAMRIDGYDQHHFPESVANQEQ
ncbi:hypothetical protein H072_7548 [Dactylellina haptotyla CBS 200.50]|uniref:Uncharacterized protein n=1 Tax=Dactylellina haptotyla (strain CBS 200.50) TaxID=1284197 RepID=S8BTT6_DACHA|nr:hypothetical protein H072_7548 [Dactylellina haptotyla CBS 200.50]